MAQSVPSGESRSILLCLPYAGVGVACGVVYSLFLSFQSNGSHNSPPGSEKRKGDSGASNSALPVVSSTCTIFSHRRGSLFSIVMVKYLPCSSSRKHPLQYHHNKDGGSTPTIGGKHTNNVSVARRQSLDLFSTNAISPKQQEISDYSRVLIFRMVLRSMFLAREGRRP